MADKKGGGGGGDSMPEVDVLLKAMLAQPGVEGFMVFNEAGIPVKWTNGGFIKPGTPNSANPIPPQIVHHAALLGDLTDKATAAAARLLGEPGGLQMMRLRTRMNEVIVAPAADSTLVVMQKAHSAAMVPVITLADQAQAAAMAEEKKAAK